MNTHLNISMASGLFGLALSTLKKNLIKYSQILIIQLELELSKYSYSGCYISFHHHLPFGQIKYKFNIKQLPELHFLLAPKRKLFSVLKVIHVHKTLIACPIWTTVISWCLLESDFYLTQAIGQVLKMYYVAPCLAVHFFSIPFPVSTIHLNSICPYFPKVINVQSTTYMYPSSYFMLMSHSNSRQDSISKSQVTFHKLFIIL